METTLDKFGRIVIPKKIREHLNLKPGTQIRILEREQALILKPIQDEPILYLKDGVLVFSGTPLEDFGEALVKHREERMRTILGKKWKHYLIRP